MRPDEDQRTDIPDPTQPPAWPAQPSSPTGAPVPTAGNRQPAVSTNVPVNQEAASSGGVPAQTPRSQSDWSMNGDLPPADPWRSMTEEPPSPSEPPRRRVSRRKVIALIVGIILLLLGAATAVFAFVYNKPENAVADAVFKLALTRPVGANGTVAYRYDDNTKLDTTFSSATQADGAFSTVLDNKLTYDGSSHDLKVSFVHDGAEQYFFKIEKLRSLIDGLIEQNQQLADAGQLLDGIVEVLDGNWVLVTQSDVDGALPGEDEDSASACIDREIEAFYNNPSQQQEVRHVYNQHQFIVIADTMGMEVIDGTLTSRYRLNYDEQKAASFARAVAETEIYKKIDDCVGGTLSPATDDLDTSDIDTQGDEVTTIDLWVDMVSHRPVKLIVESTQDDSSLRVESGFDFSSSASVEVPQPDKTTEDVQREVEQLYENYMTATMSGEGFADVQVRARDVKRSTAINALTMELEVYYNDRGYYLAPSELEETSIASKLKGFDTQALYAPDSNTYALTPVYTTGDQAPTTQQYLYQGLTDDGKICRQAADCQKYVLWYRLEETGEIRRKTSLN